jgi:adenylate kinase family enzyme
MNPILDRVVVVGTSCSGKSTFARALAGTLGHPHIELDLLHWLPDWKERPNEEFRSLVSDAVGAERWALDGNYKVVRDIVWPRATCIIWLNYSFAVTMSRAMRRTWRRCWYQEELFAGNRETFRQQFLTRDSILWWVLKTHGKRKKDYAELRRSQPHVLVPWLEFRRPLDAQQWLVSLAEKDEEVVLGSKS